MTLFQEMYLLQKPLKSVKYQERQSLQQKSPINPAPQSLLIHSDSLQFCYENLSIDFSLGIFICLPAHRRGEPYHA